jgi:hypothetical protein
MPIPGFDGSKVLMEFIPHSKLYASEAGKGFMIGAVLLLFYCVDYIFKWADWITGKVLRLFLEFMQ